MSSFQKRRTTAVLPGAKQSLHTGQQLISTGNPALDHILGGGLPIGSLLLIEEDKMCRYAEYLTKFFLAEGGVHKHALFLASLDSDPSETVKKLPATLSETKPATSPTASTKQTQPNDDMRIAWRYNSLDKVDSEQGSGSQSDGKNSYSFDLSQPIEAAALGELNLTVFNGGCIESDKSSSLFTNPVYVSLLKTLQEKFNDETFELAAQSSTATTKKNLLRICLQSVGSPLWWNENFTKDICLFLTILKAAVRTSLSVCCITMPTHLFKYFDNTLIYRIRNLVDYSIELESFAGSDKETNPVFKEYHGLLFIRKLAALNALAAHTPETYDLAFKLRRKRFVIEKLHLPPELQESEQREQDDESVLSAMSCSSNKKHLLEF